MHRAAREAGVVSIGALDRGMSFRASVIQEARKHLRQSQRGGISDPVEWALEKGAAKDLWSKQREILWSVRDNRRTAVRSAHNVGKSFAAAIAACWWIDSSDTDSVFVVTTAPTHSQVKVILWQNIIKIHSAVGLKGRTNLTEWWIGDSIVAQGKKPRDWDPDAFQGIHAERVLVIIDEAAGVPAKLWDAADTLLSSAGCHVLAIGNPTTRASEFYQVCQPDSGWNVIHVDGLESPNFTDEDVHQILRRRLLSRQWVEEKKVKWGEESPMFISRVRGRFPSGDDAERVVVPWGWAEACRGVDLEEGVGIQVGVDVGEGGDHTSIAVRRGSRLDSIHTLRSRDWEKTAGKVSSVIKEVDADIAVVDAIGIGWGVVGELRRQHNEGKLRAVIQPFKGSWGTTQPTRFLNLRDEVWWDVGRELSRTRAWDLTEADDDLIMQLSAPEYSFTAAGKVKVEPKDNVKKRIGRSPDDADALLLAFWNPPERRRSRRQARVYSAA